MKDNALAKLITKMWEKTLTAVDDSLLVSEQAVALKGHRHIARWRLMLTCSTKGSDAQHDAKSLSLSYFRVFIYLREQKFWLETNAPPLLFEFPTYEKGSRDEGAAGRGSTWNPLFWEGGGEKMEILCCMRDAFYYWATCWYRKLMWYLRMILIAIKFIEPFEKLFEMFELSRSF